MSQNNHCSFPSLVIHSDPMNTLSLCTHTPSISQESSIMDLLERHTLALGWIWSAGERAQGFWCEIFTPKEVLLFEGSSLKEALLLALEYTKKETPRLRLQ